MSNKQELIIIGAGGHAKVVLSTALGNAMSVRGFLDDNPALSSKRIAGYSVLGDTSFLLAECHDWAVFGLGQNAVRKKIAEHTQAFTQWKTLVHPSAYVHPSVELGEGTVVFAGAVIQPDVKIGKHCIVNTGATVDHDCVIEDYVHLAPGVHLAGGVHIGEGSFLGIGSLALIGINIGNWVTVGAGGVVIKDVSTGKTVMGVPAKERTEIC